MISDRLEEVSEQLLAAVDEVNSWEDPYVELYKRGVTGTPKSACECPVSTYLTAQIGGYEVVTISTSTCAEVGHALTDNLPFSKSVTDFILKFDAGMYPELVSEEN